MIGRRISGEQAEHLERFMDFHRQVAFEEADRTGRFDALWLVFGVLILCAVLSLAQFIDDFGRVIP